MSAARAPPAAAAASTSRGAPRAGGRPCRAVATAAAPAPSPVFAAGRAALLERPVGAAAPDAPLWATGAFGAAVYPDLPVAASWKGLVRAATGGLIDSPVDATTGDPASHFVVRTVGAQVRGRAAVRARMQAAAGVDARGRPLPGSTTPQALLLLSGGHPARALWAPTNSLHMLADARAMRASGDLPAGLELWAVANPLVEPPSRAAAKVDAGATVLLTQPPLLWGPWEAWWRAAEADGLPARASIVAGVALPHTPTALRFWLALAAAARLDGAGAAVADFEAATAAGRGAAHARAAAAGTLARLAGLGPGLAGVHVMPVTKGGRALAVGLVEGGELAPWTRGGGGGVIK